MITNEINSQVFILSIVISFSFSCNIILNYYNKNKINNLEKTITNLEKTVINLEKKVTNLEKTVIILENELDNLNFEYKFIGSKIGTDTTINNNSFYDLSNDSLNYY